MHSLATARNSVKGDEALKFRNSDLATENGLQNVELLDTFPVEITLTALLKCNYRCGICYQDSYEGEVDWAVVERIEPLLRTARALQIFGGEPFLYPRITDLYRMAHKHGCLITTISNGSLLSEQMCQEIVENQVGFIKLSIDAGTAATYKRIRGGDFARVMGGIKRLSRLKAALRNQLPVLDLNFLAMRSNLPELPRLLGIAAEFGIREVNVFYPSFFKEEYVADCLYFDQERSDELFQEASAIAPDLGIQLNLPPLFSQSPEPGFSEVIADKPPCLDPWTKLIIGVDGTASLCCAGPTAIGNLAEQDFQSVWNSERAAMFRRTVNTSKAPAFCRYCLIRQGSPREPQYHLKTPELLGKYSQGLRR
jgi:MoaA/NifB/PqqE/SkfB family radical SAM enzyme